MTNRQVAFLGLGMLIIGMLEPSVGMAEEEDLQGEIRELKKLVLQQQQELNQLKAAVSETPQETALEKQRELIRAIIKEEAESSPSSGNDIRVFWHDGLKLETRDGNVKLEIGGRMMYDFTWIGGSEVENRLATDLEDGSELRRGRLHVAGNILKDIDFKIEWDWAGGSAALKDTYLRFRNLPVVGNLTAGHFKEPFSLEELTSSRHTTFMERGLPNIFAPSRGAGLMLNNHLFDQQMSWAAGVFRTTDDFGTSQEDGEYAFTGRITGLPWYEEKGRKLLHVGGAYSYRNSESGMRYRQRPEAHLSPRFVDTAISSQPLIGSSTFAVESQNLLGTEVALVYGPFHAEAEFMADAIKSEVADDPTYHGYYVSAGYFLTGEHRPYKKSAGTFDRVKPLKNFRQDGGWGAWEVAGRYSHLNLNDGRFHGGKLQNVTLGLNWYLNPNVKVMWNYIHSMLDHPAGGDNSDRANIFMMRLQFDF